MESSYLLQPQQKSEHDILSEFYVNQFDESTPATVFHTESEVPRSRASACYKLWRYFRHLLRPSAPRSSPHSLWRRKCLWRVFTKTLFSSVIIFLLISLYHGIFNPSYSDPPERYRILERQVKASATPGRGNIRNEKIFIAANILNEDLIRGPWGESLLSLINLLGDENVFVSIYENDSGSGTRDALLELQQQFTCNSSVVTGAHVPLSVFPTIRLPNGQERVPRLTYLAEMRNRLLRPLDPSYIEDSDRGFRSASGTRFDKILFLNDVYFSSLDALQLLFSTNADSGEAQYRTACALDFVQLFKVYDSFVVRDTDGYQLSLQYYPWFTHVGSGTSRSDVTDQTDAVRVRSCWGGMAAFNATLFQPMKRQFDLFGDHSSMVQSPAPSVTGLPSLPLQFRDSGEPFWEAAECCLIFADMEKAFGRSLIEEGSGVLINPYVRTAYSATTWRWLAFFKRYERSTEYFQYLSGMLKHPEHNPRRLHEPGQMVDEITWIDAAVNSTSNLQPDLRSRLSRSSRVTMQDTSGHFGLVHREAQPGGFCGERRLFVMKEDITAANKDGGGKNWENIALPWELSILSGRG